MHFVGSNLSTEPKCPKCIYKITGVYKMDSRYARLLPTPYENKLSTAKGKRTNHIRNNVAKWSEDTIPATKKGHPKRCPFVAGIDGFGPSKCQSQSLVPYRLAISQYLLLYSIIFYYYCQAFYTFLKKPHLNNKILTNFSFLIYT